MNYITSVFKSIVAAAALTVICAAATNAQTTVSVNLENDGTSTQPVPASEFNGVVSVMNWNNPLIDNPTPAGGSPYGSLVDSMNNPVTGLSFSFASGGADSWNTNGSNGGRIYGDFVNNPGTLTISGIPDNDGVRLITYHNGFNNDTTTNVVDVTTNGVTLRYDDHLWDNSDHGANPFLYTAFENYLDFALPATDMITVDFQGVNGTPAINAFQLIIEPAAVPEPASIAIWSLIGLGLVAFGYYRIRR